jgi:acyl-CoA synthetase (AMP-forming)/AMP-acid ligase II
LIPTSNLASLLLQTARRFPGHPAIIWRDTTWTWASFRDRVQAAAGALAAHGVRHGDRVLVHARNSNAVLETMFATWIIGGVWVPTNFRLTPPEVAYLAASSGAAVHIFEAAFPEHAAAARAENPACRLEISIGEGWEAFATAAGDPVLRPADVDRDHPAWFFYTSGTTGRPKAGVLTHGQMQYVVCNHLCDLIPGTTENDASLVVAPLSHGAGVHALPQVARGAPTILLSGERLDCEEAWRLVERHRVTNMFTVPTILTMLTRHESVDRYDHSCLRHVIYAGAPMYRADQVQALRKLGKVLVQYFGMGEVTGNITVLPAARCTARTMRTCRLEAADFLASAWRSRSSTMPGGIWRRG